MTGDFSKEQMDDLIKGPLDNHVDMINNEWGQELGKKLKKKYNVGSSTKWTPQLLSDYLNDIQNYLGETFDVKFQDFTPDNKTVQKFTEKLNNINGSN